MDFTSFIAFIPKLAGTILVLLGILIVLEVRNILRERQNKIKLPTDSETPQEITTVKFPQTAVQTTVEDPKHTKKQSHLVFLVIPLLVVVLFIGVNIFATRQNTSETTPEEPTPTPPTIETVPPRIIIYQIDELGEWWVIPEYDLKTLVPGTEIKIAVATNRPISFAEFIVNNEVFPSNTTRSPTGELYIDYQIQEGIIDYHIAVTIQ